MTSHRSDFIRNVIERGYMHQCTDLDALDKLAENKIVSAYIGFDCTAPSLHAGSLVQIMMLRLLQRCGHKPIVLMGGGTTKVGDPSGKDESRQLLDDDAIAANMAGIKDVFAKFLTFGDGPTDAIMVNNDDWLKGIQYIDFLRDYGRHFSVNRMLGFESVKIRLEREHNLSFLEFNYMILQAYDFLELSRRHDCLLQMGGSDQWGNIVGGVDLGRRLDQRDMFGLTTPLLTTSSGAKMGKTAAGAVWLNADMLSPYDYWQYWRNTEDADVGKFLRLFTDLELDEIAELESREGVELNEVKKRLATEVTAMCHGQQAADEAAETARRTFEEGTLDAGLPSTDVARADLEAGIAVFELFKIAALATSNGEARKLIKGGGARLNDEKIIDETRSVTLNDAGADGIIKLSAGKKRHALIKPV
ncbi:MAG: tyrosine--tRNA ligase [Rhodospirillaceae bacterium]|nr:tyrosine--tRNA ligase [Rhodospirillaceae bacterium]MBL6942698.1 tyrosine--tRNA ligase [Rhodospirillales bacterium]